MDKPTGALYLAAPPQWQPDDSSDVCLICQSQFGLLNRRHHCRACGQLVCGRCSTARLPIVILSNSAHDEAQALKDPSPEHIIQPNLEAAPSIEAAAQASALMPGNVERLRVCDICEKIYRVSFYDLNPQNHKKRGSNPNVSTSTSTSNSVSSATTHTQVPASAAAAASLRASEVREAANQPPNTFEMRLTATKPGIARPASDEQQCDSSSSISAEETKQVEAEASITQVQVKAVESDEMTPKAALQQTTTASEDAIPSLLEDEVPPPPAPQDDRENEDSEANEDDDFTLTREEKQLLRCAPTQLVETMKGTSLYYVCQGAAKGLQSEQSDQSQPGSPAPTTPARPGHGTLRFASPHARLGAARTLRMSQATPDALRAAAATAGVAPDASPAEAKNREFPKKYLIPYTDSHTAFSHEAQTKRPVNYTAISLVDLFNSLWTTTHSALIDVRPAAAYVDGHPPRAISLPMFIAGDVVPLIDPSSEDESPRFLPLSEVKELEGRVPTGDARAFRSRLRRQMVICGQPPATLAEIVRRLESEVSDYALKSALDEWKEYDLNDQTLYVDPCVVRLADALLSEGKVSGVEVLEAGAPAFLTKYPHPQCVCAPIEGKAPFAARVDHKHTHVSLYPGFPSEVMDGFMYLGSRDNASNLEHLEVLGITHILNVTSEVDNYFQDHGYFKYLRIPVNDSASEELFKQFAQACSFIDEAYTKGGKVLVHCAFGVSRSATVVLAYMIRTFKITAYQALTALKTRRPQVLPNPGFMRQLCDLERLVLNSGEDSMGMLKKTFIDVEDT